MICIFFRFGNLQNTPNVCFCFRSGGTVSDNHSILIETEDSTDKRSKSEYLIKRYAEELTEFNKIIHIKKIITLKPMRDAAGSNAHIISDLIILDTFYLTD